MARLSGLEGNLPKMAAVRFLCWMHWMSAVIVPFFRDWGRLSYTQIFALQAWFMLANFLLEVPTGAVADRFGRRVSVGLGGLLLGVATLLYASVPWLPVFFLGETVFALGLTLISGADEALVYDSLKALGREQKATRVMSRLAAWMLAGLTAGALLGAVAAARLGVRAPFLLQALPMALSGVMALTLREPPRAREADDERRGYLRLISGGLHHFRRAPELRALAVDLVACSTVASLVFWVYQPQLMRASVPLAAFGVVHAGMALGQILFLARVPLLERLSGGRVRLLRLTAWLPAVCLLVLAATAQPALSIGLILVATVAGAGRTPLFSGALNARIPSERRATVLSAVSASRTLLVGVLYPAIGAILDRSLPAALVFVGAAGIAAAIFGAAPGELLEEKPAAPAALSA